MPPNQRVSTQHRASRRNRQGPTRQKASGEPASRSATKVSAGEVEERSFIAGSARTSTAKYRFADTAGFARRGQRCKNNATQSFIPYSSVRSVTGQPPSKILPKNGRGGVFSGLEKRRRLRRGANQARSRENSFQHRSREAP